MKHLLFSLILIGGVLPSIAFGLTPEEIKQIEEERIQWEKQDAQINPISPETETAPVVEESLFKTREEIQADYQNRNASLELTEAQRVELKTGVNPTTQNLKTENTSPAAKPAPTNNSFLDSIISSKSFGGQPLSNLLNQLFWIGLVGAVVLALVMVIRGGVEYMTIDSISGKENGKNRIQAALGGLLLAFSAILILNTINPGLTKLSIVFAPLQKINQTNISTGITSGTRSSPMTGQSTGDTSSVIKGDFSNVTASDLRPHLGSNYSDADIQAFVDAGKQYGIDPRFLASISKFETTNGTSKAFTDGRNNAMGTSNSVGPIGFSSVRDSIFIQAKNLVKDGGYYSKATTIQQIGDIYSPSVNPATGKPYQNDLNGTNWSWAGSVSSNYKQMTTSAQ